MKKTSQRLSVAGAALAVLVGVPTPANAVFVARICNDLQCQGGDDFIVQDNSGSDTIAMSGATSFSTTAFGYTLLVNTSQSKPVVGSATAPELDVTFSATRVGGAGNVFLYASDTDFTLGNGTFAVTLGGTNSGGSG